MNMQAKRPILPISVTRPRSLARARFTWSRRITCACRSADSFTWSRQRSIAMSASSVKALLYLGIAIAGAGSPAAAGNTTMSAPAAPVACVTQSGIPCPKDHFAMEHEETYKGTKIRIRTGRAPDGAWQATAEVANQTSAAPLAAPGTYASEQEARSAALSAAAAEVDRSRAGTGKP